MARGWGLEMERPRIFTELERWFSPWFDKIGVVGPPMDLWESHGNIIVRVELPGVDPEGVDVYVTETALTVKARVAAEDELPAEGFIRRERRYGLINRVVTLPAKVRPNDARAAMRNGVLTITLPMEEQAHVHGVKIRVESDPAGYKSPATEVRQPGQH